MNYEAVPKVVHYGWYKINFMSCPPKQAFNVERNVLFCSKTNFMAASFLLCKSMSSGCNLE
jgi:hypothetical protein